MDSLKHWILTILIFLPTAGAILTLLAKGRDGVRFYFDRTPPFGSPRLLRTPGLRKIEPAQDSTRAVEPL